jgi:hypothetical protein
MSDSLVPPVLNPASLYKEEAKRDATRIRIYNMVLQQIYNKIKAIARIPGNERSLMYVIPEFIPGTPRFDMGDAVLYIVWNLRNVGYIVNYTHPNFLYISWKPHDERYKQTESPWSVVLNTVRNSVLTSNTPVVNKPHPQIEKRKTLLKKTVEFKPTVDIVQSSTSHPSVASALYSGIQTSTVRLPGQLTDKHISFV